MGGALHHRRALESRDLKRRFIQNPPHDHIVLVSPELRARSSRARAHHELGCVDQAALAKKPVPNERWIFLTSKDGDLRDREATDI